MKPKPIFSGDNSRELWNEINSAKTISHLRAALYSLGCRCQELEAEVRKLQEQRNAGT